MGSYLLSSFQQASIRPHDAFQAVKCLRYLLISSEKVVTAMIEMNVMDAIVSSASTSVSVSTGDDDGLNYNCHHNHHHHEGLKQEINMLMAQLLQIKKDIV